MFTVPGRPLPWQRAGSRYGHRYTPPEMVAYQNKIKLCALAAGVRPLTGLVRIDVIAYLPDRRRRDWDNIGKTVSDALEGVAYADDAQVWDGRVRKRLEPGNLRLEVTIEADT